MSEAVKRPYAQVMRVAECLADALRPSCHRIEIAGSLRRQKEMVGDIELVAIPIAHTNLLGEPIDATLVDDALALWPVTFAKRGRKYQQFSFEWQPGWIFKVDLFLQPDPATWPVNFLLRTGSSEFSHKMVTAISYGGYKPDHFEIRDARVWHRGAAMDLTDEIEIFDLWGMDFVEPEKRL